VPADAAHWFSALPSHLTV